MLAGTMQYGTAAGAGVPRHVVPGIRFAAPCQAQLCLVLAAVDSQAPTCSRVCLPMPVQLTA